MENEERILGLDLGTNSIGWAIIRRTQTGCELLNRGTTTFEKGVTMTKTGEVPSVKERTDARGARTLIRHRRNRKIKVIKLLVKFSLCPELSENEIKGWKVNKEYPLNPDFLAWQRTDDKIDKNPYCDRYQCLTRKLDLTIESERYILGRALYHITQRRGFWSNRKDRTQSSDGAVSSGINQLSNEIHEANCEYLGEYYYKLYQEGKKIRCRYSDRIMHYEKEFYAICDKQNLDEKIVKELHDAIFFQNPLKSQRGTIARCTFEPSKRCCPISHPLYEEFRMLCYINNIKIKSPNDSDYRYLNDAERKKILPLFFRKSKKDFEFSEIAVALVGKNTPYASKEERGDYDYRFNFRKESNVTGCTTIASLKNIFGDDWEQELASLYMIGDGKTQDEIVNDVWHVLYSFNNDQCVKDWGIKNLQLDEKKAISFSKIDLQPGYGSLSLKAIRKIIVYLRKGLRYDEAVLLANVRSILPKNISVDEFNRIENNLIQEIYDFRVRNYNKDFTKRDFIKSYLEDVPGIDLNKLDRLYHPSMIELYEDAKPNKDGVVLLGSPRTSSLRNPMVMRALFRLRHLINTLIKEKQIDQYTKVNIEFSRELNDANKRKAIQDLQKENEKARAEAREEIMNFFTEEYKKEIEPTEDEIDKYILWEEQNRHCIYTGEEIAIHDFIGKNPAYDIEHTIPRSRGGDNSMMNKTLCDAKFNREIKRTMLPSQLLNYKEVMAHIESKMQWDMIISKYEKEISKARTSPTMTKDAKDKIIVKRHIAKMKLDYWRGKMQRFTMTEIPEGFTNRQGVDTGIITRYARLYLKSYFNKSESQVFTVKGATTAEFRKLWGLQDIDSKKDRSNNVHHCIDAIVIACIGRREYQEWAEYKTSEERAKWDNGFKPVLRKPWATFTQDVKKIVDELLVYNYVADNMPRRTKKICKNIPLSKRNSVQSTFYSQGDSARATLHDATYYGAIKKDDKIKYVLRTLLSKLKESDIDNIVDDVVRKKVQQAVAERGFKQLCSAPVWMNEEKGIEIKKVRIETKVTDPIRLKKHRDSSVYEHKQDYYVTNDSNYCLCIYEGINKKGKLSRNMKIENNMEAAKRFLNKNSDERRIPKIDENGYSLKYVLKIGTKVLFYEKCYSELLNCSDSVLRKRLYKVFGLWKDYRILLSNVQETINSKTIGGAWKLNEEYRPSMIIAANQFNALIEGIHFKMSESGKISFLID